MIIQAKKFDVITDRLALLKKLDTNLTIKLIETLLLNSLRGCKELPHSYKTTLH